MNDGLIKIKATVGYILFPKPPKVLGEGEDTFGIVNWRVEEVVDKADDVSAQEVRGTVTVTGTYNVPLEMEVVYNIVAKKTEHEKYGVQFQAIFVGKDIDFSQLSNQKTFLKSFLTDQQIESLYAVCSNPLQVIADHDYETLKKATGIKEYISHCIVDRFEAVRDNCEVYVALDGFGLTPAFIQKLLVHYTNPEKVITVVKEHPYQLCLECDGIGFKTADTIAQHGGIASTDVERIKAFIYTQLTELAETGNSYITAQKLHELMFTNLDSKDKLLQIYETPTVDGATNNIAQALKELDKEDLVKIEPNAVLAERRVYLSKYYNLEQNIANELKRIAQGQSKIEVPDWEERVRQQEAEQGWLLTEEQRAGVEMCLTQQVALITGGAGTGKSSVLAAVLRGIGCLGEPLEDGRRFSFAQCSLSGKAAARMEEVTHQKGGTIHRLLGYDGIRMKHDADNPLDYDVIVVDEISLVGGEIFYDLLCAIPTGSKLIILGDMGQLESIGCLNLAHDLSVSDYIPHIELTKIHRQAQRSGIIVAAQAVRCGESITELIATGNRVLGELQDMVVDNVREPHEIPDLVVNHFKQAYTEILNDGGDIMDVQVLCPVKERGNACVSILNNLLQEVVNPQGKFLKNELFIKMGKEKNNFVLREDDKVLCIQNNYHVEDLDGEETEIFNGWTGIIEKIDTVGDTCVVHFPHVGKRVRLTCADVQRSIMLGYACTVHKYQGSQAHTVIGVLTRSTPPMMLTRELVYTMLTRAVKKCVLISQPSAISQSIKHSGVTNKNTFLTEMLDHSA